MDKRKIEAYVKDFWLDALMVLAGLILLLNPDGATALVTKLVGWVLVIGCALRLISLATADQLRWGVDAFFIGAILCVGVIFLAKPLILANLIGRFFGILLLVEGLQNLRSGGFRLLTILTVAAGVVLIIMPRTLTQTVLAICGVVLLIIGIINILGKLTRMKRLNQGTDPNIIDADV